CGVAGAGAGVGAAVGAGAVGAGAGVGAGVGAVAGPVSCGVGDCGASLGPPPPGVRHSIGSRCGRVCIPYFRDFHWRLSRCTIGYTGAPGSSRTTPIASSKLWKQSMAPYVSWAYVHRPPVLPASTM